MAKRTLLYGLATLSCRWWLALEQDMITNSEQPFECDARTAYYP